MQVKSAIVAIGLVLTPFAAQAVSIDIMPTASRTVLADGGTVSSNFQIMDPADFDNSANPLGITLGVNTPYDWEIQFDATSGFDPGKDYAGYLDFAFSLAQTGTPTVTSTLNTLGSLTDVTLQWLDTTLAPIGSAAALTDSISATTTSAVAANTLATLRVSWSGFAMNGVVPVDYTPNIDFNVTTTPVPVPGALPLMASAFGLIGWTGRRRRKAA